VMEPGARIELATS